MGVVLYADVEYFGRVYWDAELVDGKWFFEDGFGGVHPFMAQDLINVLQTPSSARRHAPSESGQVSEYKNVGKRL